MHIMVVFMTIIYELLGHPRLEPGGDFHTKKTGGSMWEILKRTPKNYTDPVLEAWIKMFLLHNRYQS